ncbi:MAG TPA: hypothetical protein VL947_10555, partial [Cytophagales bacterium]|nr:hypothetical protein [Cytophagales bacterium]
ATYTSGVTSFDQLSTFVEGAGNTAYPTSGKTEYTVTVYSAPMNTVLQIAGPQRNIQNRVSYTYSMDTRNRRAVTYYSYDVHGNVEWIIQDIPGFSQYLIGYEYDLISNKVTKLSFNKGRVDAFYHKYEYDADNRIVAVYTSKDGELWDKDASYEYFKHGPLKRTILGEDRVQGLDYTYTIHGWLKAINSHNKGAANDPSKDGAPANGTDPESKVAIDEWAMMLQYYTGDFTRTSSPFMESILPTTGTTAKDLFNGNITALQSRIPEEYRRLKTATTSELATMPVLTGQQYTYSQSFTYDELNRIVTSEAFKYSSRGDIPVGTSPFTATDDYKTSYSYDANGNLLTLNRNGFIRPDGNGKDMDKLRYKYNLDANSKPTNNKLRGVDDDVVSDVYGTTDLDDQYEEENYQYDANGNLTTDYQEGINITWNSFGKVSEINPMGARLRIRYIYDAYGNRIAKEAIDFVFGGPGYGATTTAYVRDAAGNVLAVYEKRTDGGYDGFSNTFKQKEVHLYGSGRIGMYAPDKQVAQVSTTRSGIDRQYIYEDVQQRTESNKLKWIQHIDKTQSVSSANKLYRYLVYATQTYNTTSAEYMDAGAGNTITNLPANAHKNIFQAEDKAGNILFSGFVARSYMGKNNVCLLFNSANALMQNSGGLNIDPNAKSVVVQIPNSNDFMLISRGLDKKLYYHTISTTSGVLTKNTELVPGTTGYSPSLAVVEDFAQRKVVVYATKFDGTALHHKIAAITITKPSTAIVTQSIDMYTQNAGIEDCEIKVTPKTEKLVLVTFDNMRQGFFEYRTSLMNTFSMGVDYKISNLDPQPVSAVPADGLYIEPRTYQFEVDGTYELHVDSYRTITTGTGGTVLGYGYGPLMRRPDGQMSAFYNSETPGQNLKPSLIQRIFYGYFVMYNTDGLTTNVIQLSGAKVLPYSHVQNFRKYQIIITDPTFRREVGAKSYELTDHLDNVSVVVGDLIYKVYSSSSTNTTVILATAVRPEGLYAQVLSYTNYY